MGRLVDYWYTTCAYGKELIQIMGSSGDHYVNIWISGQQATFLGQKWSGIRIDTEIIGKLLGYHIKRQLSWFMA